MKYVTNDGVSFDSFDEAEKHEKEVVKQQRRAEWGKRVAECSNIRGLSFAYVNEPEKQRLIMALPDNVDWIGWMLQVICPNRYVVNKMGEVENRYNTRGLGSAQAKKSALVAEKIVNNLEEWRPIRGAEDIYIYVDDEVEIYFFGGDEFNEFFKNEYNDFPTVCKHCSCDDCSCEKDYSEQNEKPEQNEKFEHKCNCRKSEGNEPRFVEIDDDFLARCILGMLFGE